MVYNFITNPFKKKSISLMAEDNVRGETIEKDLQIDSLSMNMIWNRIL